MPYPGSAAVQRWLRTGLALTLVTVSVLAVGGSGHPRAPASPGFIGKAGTSLTLNGQPVRELGYNYDWIGPSCGGAGSSYLQTVFSDIIANSKANLVRVGVYERYSGTYPHGSLEFGAFDKYIWYAKKHGLRLLPMLADNWGKCGDGNGEKYLPWYQSGYTRPESSTQPLSYHDWAVAFAQRYANEPTVAWIQLVNEPDGRNPDGTCTEGSAATAMRSFADTMTTAVKSVDPNHLVDLGAISRCGGQNYCAVSSCSPGTTDDGYVNGGNVDICDLYHDYNNNATSLPSGLQNGITQCIGYDAKPGFVGESGICAYVDSAGACTTPTTATTLQDRAAFFSAKMSAAFNDGLSGYLIWATSHACSGSDSSTLWNVGAGNGNPANGCAVTEADPTESVMASFALATPQGG